MRRLLVALVALVAVCALDAPAPVATAQEVHGGGATCSHCHADPHAGTAKGTCTDCHTTEAFAPSTFDAARHAATGFPLQGKHAAVACS